MASHYGTAVIPARPYRPKDKSRVELSVLLVYRWLLARLRHQLRPPLRGKVTTARLRAPFGSGSVSEQPATGSYCQVA